MSATLIQCEDKDDVRVITFVEREMGINFDAELLGQELAQAMEGLDKPKVVLNMDEVAYVCSRVIATLIHTHKRAWQAGGHIALSNVSDYVHETLRAAKLHRFLDLFATEEEAIACLDE